MLLKKEKEDQVLLTEESRELLMRLGQTANALSALSKEITRVAGQAPTLPMLLEIYRAKATDRAATGEMVLSWAATGQKGVQARLDKDLTHAFVAKMYETPVPLSYKGPMLTEEFFLIDSEGTVSLSPETTEAVHAKHRVVLSKKARKMLEWARAYSDLYNSMPSGMAFRNNVKGFPLICEVRLGKMTASPELAAKRYN